MCGRYALDQNARELANHFGLLEVPDWTPRYNIAPSTSVLVIRQVPRGRVGELMTWGLAPAWARREDDARKFPKPINARADTLAQRPMFRNAFRTRRCIVPASGFYEWRRPASGPAQPFYIHPANDPVFGFAGLYEPGIGEAPSTCCIVTTNANELMATIHDRMPVILDPADFASWLDPAAPMSTVEPLLAPFASDEMLAHPVSTRVNVARNDEPGLLAPLPRTD